MTAHEVFDEITSKEKWYAGYISPQYATNIKRKFKNGELSFRTLEKVFNHFGYYLSDHSPWQKIVNSITVIEESNTVVVHKMK